MKEAAPRIFRSLETSHGQAGFDLIVAAAVSAYGSLRAPSEAQARDFGRLVAPLWPRTSPEARRSVSAALSHAPRMPRELVDQLVAAPLEIAAPFLVSSPVLSLADMQTLAAQADPRMDRILESRRERWPSTGVSEARDGPRALPVLEAPTLAPDHLGAPEPAPAPLAGEAAQAVRTTLRRLVQPGRPAGRNSDARAAALLQFARDRDRQAFFACLAQHLSLSPTQLREARSDESGHALARILKALQIGAGDAAEMLMRVHENIGLSVPSFEAVTRFYRDLDAGTCMAAFAAPRPASDQPVAGRRTARSDEPAPRPAFGRRTHIPRSQQKNSGS